MKINLYIWIFVFFLLMQISLAVPPSSVAQIPEFSEGLVITYPAFTYIKEGSPYSFAFHVNNKSNGMPITSGISCDLHIDNSSSGEHIFEGVQSIIDHNFDYSFNIPANNFSESGYYSFTASCNDTAVGSVINVAFEVTDSGKGEQDKVNFTITPILLLIVGMAFFVFIGTLFFTESSNIVYKIASMPFFLIAFLLFIVGISITGDIIEIGVKDYINLNIVDTSNALINKFEAIYKVATYISIGALIIFFVYGLYAFIKRIAYGKKKDEQE